MIGRPIMPIRSLPPQERLAMHSHDEDQRRLHTETLADAIALPIGRWSREARLLFCNAPYEAWAHRPRQALLGRSLAELYGDEAWDCAQPAFARAFEGSCVSYERMQRHHANGERWARVQVFPDFGVQGCVDSVYTIAFDIHDDVLRRNALENTVRELTLAQERLKRSVELDALTEVLSRRAMMERIDAAVTSSAEQPVALFFIDLDGFKAVNDAFGHREGDRVLSGIASALRQAVRAQDAVGRFGGDEFLVLAPVHERLGAEAMAQHLHNAVREAGAELIPRQRVTASIGYALAPLEATQPLKLIQLADAAMYAAKRLGHNRAPSGLMRVA